MCCCCIILNSVSFLDGLGKSGLVEGAQLSVVWLFGPASPKEAMRTPIGLMARQERQEAIS